MRLPSRLAVPLLLLILAGASSASACTTRPDAAEIGSRYVLRGALAYDSKTRLTWQRCGYGQQFRDGRCVGALTLVTPDEAAQAARKAGTGWRVPTVDELASLVTQRCRPPMLNPQVFPDVRAVSEGKAAFWSSSRHEALPMLTYNVDFIAPAVDANTAGVSMGVRLVRSGRFPEQVTPRPD